jgi:hypothetical protein
MKIAVSPIVDSVQLLGIMNVPVLIGSPLLLFSHTIAEKGRDGHRA